MVVLYNLDGLAGFSGCSIPDSPEGCLWNDGKSVLGFGTTFGNVSQHNE